MAYVKYPTTKELDRELKQKRLDNIYLFIGEEDGEKEKYIKRITDMILDQEGVGNYFFGRFHIENDGLLKASDFALSSSMFSERKVCLMQNIDCIKSSDTDKSQFHGMLEGLPDSNILIMTTNDNKIPSFINKDVLHRIKVFHFWRYFENEMKSYVNSSLKGYGFDIDHNAVDRLVELLGSDIKKIDSAIDKIICSDERIITLDIVDSIIYNEKDITVFDFIDNLYIGNKKALKQLSKLIEDGVHELPILSLIYKQAEKIEKYHFLINEGKNENEILREVGVFPKKRIAFIAQTRKNSSEDIKRIFPLIFKADFQIRSVSSNSLLANPVFDLVSEMLNN